MRLSIDISADEHRKLKALAALSGESIKAYIMKRVLPSPESTAPLTDEANELAELEAFLEGRIKSAAQQNYSERTVSAIFEDEIEGA